jgi:hypothetical protein
MTPEQEKAALDRSRSTGASKVEPFSG